MIGLMSDTSFTDAINCCTPYELAAKPELGVHDKVYNYN